MSRKRKTTPRPKSGPKFTATDDRKSARAESAAAAGAAVVAAGGKRGIMRAPALRSPRKAQRLSPSRRAQSPTRTARRDRSSSARRARARKARRAVVVADAADGAGATDRGAAR